MVGGVHPQVLDLPHLFEICDEAFREQEAASPRRGAPDKLCLPRQIAYMEGVDLGGLLEEFDACQRVCYPDPERSPFESGQSWRSIGATPRMLLELASRWQYHCLVWQSRFRALLPCM